MFERQIKKEFDRLQSLFIDSDSVNYHQLISLLNDNPFYRTFVQADSYYQNFKTLSLLSAEQIFSENINKNINASDNFYNFLLYYSNLNKSYLNELLQIAVELRFNYSVRPFTTLVSFIFADSVSISANEAKLKSEYFSGHNSIRKIIEDTLDFFIQNSPDVTLFKANFVKKFSLNLKKYLLEIDNYSLIHLTDEVYDFLEESGSDNLAVISLIIFFDDIRISGLAEKLDSVKNSNEYFTRQDLEILINEMMKDNNIHHNNEEIISEPFIHQSELYIKENVPENTHPEIIEIPDFDEIKNNEPEFNLKETGFSDFNYNLNSQLDIRINSLTQKIDSLYSTENSLHSEEVDEEALASYRNELADILEELEKEKNS